LVIGATGKQGGAVVEHLLKNGKFKVRALTRDVNTDKAKALANSDVEVVTGSTDDKKSLENAMKGVYGVFSVTVFDRGVDKEVEDGILVNEIAKAANVKHFIFTSAAGADRKSGVPHFESKFKIEEHLKKTGLPYTIIRPVFFYENFLRQKDAIKKGQIKFALKPNAKLQTVAADDIGGFVAQAFEHPEKYIGKAIDFASNERTLTEYAKILGVENKEQPLDEVQNHDISLMYKFIQENEFRANVTELKKEYPLTDFKTWVDKVGLAKP